MKTALLLLFAFLQSTETPVEYREGKITPLFARAVAGRPFLNQAEVSIALTAEQRFEIRVLQAELKAARAELRALEAKWALLLHEGRDDVRALEARLALLIQKPITEKKQ